MPATTQLNIHEQLVRIPCGRVSLEGMLSIPSDPTGIVLFAHGSGSSRHSPRNRAIAAELQSASHATLLMDLLTLDEEHVDNATSEFRFDIAMLAQRLICAADWLRARPDTSHLPIGCFGASTGAAAALIAAAMRPELVGAVVSRGGRPDLAKDFLPQVRCPTLMVVGSHDTQILTVNQSIMQQMRCPVRLEIILGATHLFSEPGALEQVSRLARDWFTQHLK
jgi:dienelactone hydrolase